MDKVLKETKINKVLDLMLQLSALMVVTTNIRLQKMEFADVEHIAYIYMIVRMKTYKFFF